MSKYWKWIKRLIIAGLAAGLLGICAVAAVLWVVWPRLPNVQALRDIELQVPMSVYSSDGKLISLFGETRRYPVAIKDVPQQVKNAFIAIEDARFYQHDGLDWRGIGRAVWLLATTDDKRVPGGSTITQQVARSFFLSAEYSYSRKFMEMLLALKIERQLSKDEIFELYLNKIFFGNRSYGVAAAAEYYYGKKLTELTLPEAAMLAGIPKFPSSGNPLTNPARARIRRDYILQRMYENGFINETQMRAAQAGKDTASPHEPRIEAEAPYVAEMVRQSMEQRFGPAALTSGYRVYTTLDSTDQANALKAVRDGLIAYDRRHGWRGAESRIELNADMKPEDIRKIAAKAAAVTGLTATVVTAVDNRSATVLPARGEPIVLTPAAVRWTGRSLTAALKRGDLIRIRYDKEGKAELAQLPSAQSALISLDADTGALRALVGGFSFSLNKFNRATQAQRQPGSSFKPFVYSAAFERGYTPASIVMDAPVVFRDRAGNVWRPQNDNETFAGPMRLREAMVQSRNLVSVRLLDAMGVEFASRYIANFGFSPESLPPNLSMSLGSSSLTPLSIARAYTVFANGGYLVEPYFIARVDDRNGVTIMKTHPPSACPNCPLRQTNEQRIDQIVDGFDLSSGPASMPATTAATEAKSDDDDEDKPASGKPIEAPAPRLPFDSKLVGPPREALAPRAVDERTAFLVRSLMLDVVQRGTGTAAKVLEREDIGGKTGSTNEFRDAWFSGFGGNRVTTVWVGKDDFQPLGRGEYGGRAALPIWIDYMREALKDQPLRMPAPPSGVVTVTISRSSGGLLPKDTPGGMVDYIKSEDYDRIVSSGLPPEVDSNGETAFDIF